MIRYKLVVEKLPSIAVPVWRKFLPYWWFGIADYPHPPGGLSYFNWYTRNFLHNFFWYVVGVSDRKRIVWMTDWSHGLFSSKPGWKVFRTSVGCLTLYGVSYWWIKGSADNYKQYECAVGWSDSGAFNLKFRRTINGKNFPWE